MSDTTTKPSCGTCLHKTTDGLNEVKPLCWDCTSFKTLVHWEPKVADFIPIYETPPVPQSIPPMNPLDYAKLHGATEALTPSDYLEEVKGLIATRGTERDKPQGERSMAQTVDIFRAMSGVELTESQGWQFMIALKFARMAAGKFKLDDYLDAIGYTALMTEAVVNGDN